MLCARRAHFGGAQRASSLRSGLVVVDRLSSDHPQKKCKSATCAQTDSRCVLLLLPLQTRLVSEARVPRASHGNVWVSAHPHCTSASAFTSLMAFSWS